MDITTFLDFFTKLAPEGETALIVRQKPQLKNNEVQLHADGAIKATWPASIPDIKRIKPDQAWYGNTGSFIVSRFRDGEPSASKANCDFVLVMMLDDVGTKAKIPPIDPTWIMETSEGSFQWGYAFSEQPTVNEYTAAIKAIAEAGYTDPGATNAVRNFRLPGSINLKPGRNKFAARLVEFHPEREFTLQEICDSLGVKPHPADTASVMRPIRLADDGADDVAAWLSEQGMVLSRPNGEGWMGVVCPNNAQHTDGNPEGRYNPSMRAYACMHSHCIDFDSNIFLQWVSDQGGPKHAPGLRDELLASVYAGALSKLTPTDAFKDDAAARIAEIEEKELGRIERTEWFKRFGYIQDNECFFDLRDRREISRPTFNALYRHIDCRSMHNPKRRIEASVSFDEGRQKYGAPALCGVTYAAGDDVLVERNGLVYGNRWRNLRQPAIPGDVSPWLEHCEKLIPESEELEHIFNVMAYTLQHPKIKVNHAILHGGHQGSGKDSMWAPLFWAIRGNADENVRIMTAAQLFSAFHYQLETEILVLNELREPEARERRALANLLKPIIAAPPDTLTVNRKGLHPFDMPNRLFVLAFSNDRVSITLDSDDRRWFCVWSNAPRMQPHESAKLWKWYKSGGLAYVAAWLYARDVSAFNPAGAPPMTDFKRSMIEQGMSGAEAWLFNQIVEREGEFKRGVIAGPFQGLCARLAGIAPIGIKVPPAALMHALQEAGWVDCGRVMSTEYTTKKHIFAAPELFKRHKKAELRRMVETPPTPTLVKTA